MAMGIHSALQLHPAGMVLSQMAQAIKGLYNMGVSINDFVDDHIEQMKKSDNATISKTGRVIEGAKYGFGIGYMSSVVIIATGQLLLGNTFSAVATTATAAVLSNPIAMTCAAVGAIYYGWSALSSDEKDAILERLKNGLEIGIETIKAVVAFVVRLTKELLSPENIAEFKSFIKTYAAKFGKSLSDVTGKMMDILKDAAEQTVKVSVEVYESTAVVVTEMASQTGDAASIAAEVTSNVAKSAFESTSLFFESTSVIVKSAIGKAGDAASVAAEAASASAKDLYEKTAAAASNLSPPKLKVPGVEVEASRVPGEHAGPTEGKAPKV